MRKDEEKRSDSNFAEGAVSILSVLKHDSRVVHAIYLLPEAKRDEKNILKLLALAKKRRSRSMPLIAHFSKVLPPVILMAE